MGERTDNNEAALPEERTITRVLHAVNRIFARGYHHIEIGAPVRLPRRGAAILVCNHVSGLDPLLIQAVCPRTVVWMMAKEYYDVPTLAWVYRAVNAIAVERRGRDLAATRAAMRALASGHVVGIFPEGRIETSRELLPFQTGVALMAIKTGVDVYPAYLDGTQRGKEMVEAVMGANNAHLTFGPPVPFDRTSTSREALESATAAIRDAVAGLRDGRKLT